VSGEQKNEREKGPYVQLPPESRREKAGASRVQNLITHRGVRCCRGRQGERPERAGQDMHLRANIFRNRSASGSISTKGPFPLDSIKGNRLGVPGPKEGRSKAKNGVIVRQR